MKELCELPRCKKESLFVVILVINCGLREPIKIPVHVCDDCRKLLGAKVIILANKEVRRNDITRVCRG